MPKRGENIRKRKDGRWEGRFITGYKPDGKAKYRSIYGGSYLEVKRRLLQEIEKHTTNALPGPCKSMSFREVLFLWLDSRKLKLRPQTYAKYSQMIENHLAESIDGYKLSKLDTPTINRFIEEKFKGGRLDAKGGLSITYVKTLIFIMRSSLDFAVSHSYCQPLKCELGEVPKTKREFSVFSPDEQQRLESFVQSNMDGTKLGVLLCLHTGLRIGEICGLKWSDIDWRQNTLSVQRSVYRAVNPNRLPHEPKTKLVVGMPKTLSSYRIIPIPSYLIPLLASRKQRAISEWVVADVDCPAFDPRTYQYRFKGYLKACGIPNRNFHALRHAFATRCIEVGMDVKTLSELLGHSNVNITLNTYVHSSLELKRTQIERLASIRGQISGQ